MTKSPALEPNHPKLKTPNPITRRKQRKILAQSASWNHGLNFIADLEDAARWRSSHGGAKYKLEISTGDNVGSQTVNLSLKVDGQSDMVNSLE